MSVPSLISTKEASRLSAYAVGIGSELNMKDVTRPKGMLEHVVDIFTLGGVRREKEEVYKSVISELRSVLHDKKITPDSLQKMRKIELHLNNMHITLRPDSRYNAMQITVSKGSEKAESFVPDSNFIALCSSIMLREKLGLSRDNDLLMPDGKFNLSDIADSRLSHFEIVKELVALPVALRWNLPENIQKSLNFAKDKANNHSAIENSSRAVDQQVITEARSETGSDSILFMETRTNSESDFAPAIGYYSGMYSDGDTLSLYSTLEGDAESNTTLYHNMRNHKDLSIKVS